MKQNRKNPPNFLQSYFWQFSCLPKAIFASVFIGGPRGQTVPQVVSKGISPVCDVPEQVPHARSASW